MIYNNVNIEDKPYYQYAIKVINGDIIACNNIKMACKRFIDDLKRDDLIFYPDKVDRCIRFLSMFKHYKGKYANTHFKLEDWQQWILANVIGLYNKEYNVRKHTKCYLSVARKNGKSFFINALAMYFLIADGEPSSEILMGANSREQVMSIDYEMTLEFAKQLDPNGKLIKTYRSELKIPSIVGKLKCISNEKKVGDGYNPSVGLIDEYHCHADTSMRDVMVSGMGSRKQPLLFIITTAGFRKDYPCYALQKTNIEILKGLKEDETSFSAIYELDDGDDWKDENMWIKSNPNLGVTISTKYLSEVVNSALANPTEEVNVKTKNLNLWCDAAEVWITDSKIVEVSHNIKLEDYKEMDCYVGVDLSSVSDLTAVSYMFPMDNGEFHYFVDYYLPQTALNDKFNKALYYNWVKDGYLKLTDGNVVDYDYIANDIIKRANDDFNIITIGFDKWNATSWAIKMVENGMPMQEFGQNISTFTKPTKELERLLLSDKIKIQNNPITRFCFKNVSIKEDWNENIKVTKTAYQNKIDGVVAMIQSLGCYLENNHYTNEITII